MFAKYTSIFYGVFNYSVYYKYLSKNIKIKIMYNDKNKNEGVEKPPRSYLKILYEKTTKNVTSKHIHKPMYTMHLVFFSSEIFVLT